MKVQCPFCSSRQITQRRSAMKFGAIVGGLGGVARGISMTLTANRLSGPLGSTTCAIGAALIGGLAGGAKGCMLGAHLGHELDNSVLANYLCHNCGKCFSLCDTST